MPAEPDEEFSQDSKSCSEENDEKMGEESEGEKDKSEIDSKFDERSNHSVDDS
jgi:hypothetical protein